MSLETKVRYIIRFFKWLGMEKSLVLFGTVITIILLARCKYVIGYEPYKSIQGESGTSNITIEATRTATISEDISLSSIAFDLAGEMDDEIALISTFNNLCDNAQSVSKKKAKYIVPAEASRIIYPSISCYMWKEKSVSCLRYILSLGNVKDPNVTICFLLIVDENYYYGNVRTRLLGIGGSIETGIIKESF